MTTVSLAEILIVKGLIHKCLAKQTIWTPRIAIARTAVLVHVYLEASAPWLGVIASQQVWGPPSTMPVKRPCAKTTIAAGKAWPFTWKRGCSPLTSPWRQPSDPWFCASVPTRQMRVLPPPCGSASSPTSQRCSSGCCRSGGEVVIVPLRWWKTLQRFEFGQPADIQCCSQRTLMLFTVPSAAQCLLTFLCAFHRAERDIQLCCLRAVSSLLPHFSFHSVVDTRPLQHLHGRQ